MLVLTAALALGAAAVLLALVMLLVEPEPIEGLGTSQRQDAESAVYLLTFGAILPLALLAGPRVSRRIESGPNASALSALVAILACALAGAVLVVRIAVELDVTSLSRVLLAVGALWWLLAAGLLLRARSERPLPGGPALERAEGALWIALAVLVFLCALAVTRRDEIAPWTFALGLLAAVPITIALARSRPRRLAGSWGRALDACAIALILLAVPDLVVIEPDAAGATALTRFLDGVVQFHHDFLLGPANQVLGGDAVLVDTASQYGVGSIWFLAGWFQLVPIGYGTFGLLDGLLTALSFAAGFAVMRLAGVSRLLAAAATALGVAVLVYAREFPVGAIPQEGPLRFGLPLLAILGVVAGARLGRRGLGQAVALAALGLASVWSIESFGMTGVTLAALVCAEAALLRPGERAGPLKRWILLGMIACVSAHVLLALLTLAVAGEPPDWGQYLAFLRAFLADDLGNLTYDFIRFSPALAVAVGYLVGAVAVVLFVRERPELAGRERAMVLALAGTSAYGIVLFYYFVDRSAVHVLVYVCMPLLVSWTIWLAFILRTRDTRLRAGAIAASLALAVLLVAVAWPSIGPRFERSALAHVPPGEPGLRDALDRLTDFPPVNLNSPKAERMLARHLPGERRSLVLIRPDMITEVLMRSERSNRLPLADPIEDGFTLEERQPGLRTAAAELEEGDRMLIDDAALLGLAAVKADPDSDLLEQPVPGAATAPLELYALREIDRRFVMRPVARADGYVVVELEAR